MVVVKTSTARQRAPNVNQLVVTKPTATEELAVARLETEKRDTW